MVHGHVLHFPPYDSPVKQTPVMLHNELRDGQRYFRNISLMAGDFFRVPVLGRGLAIGDLDNDGWPDVVVSNTNTPVVLLGNIVSRHAPANWIGLKLVGKGNRDIVGSTVIVESGGRVYTKFVKGGGSYLSAGDPRLLFGLGSSDTVQKISVKWAWGGVQTWENLRTGKYSELMEAMP